jgi:DREV methyltransferase
MRFFSSDSEEYKKAFETLLNCTTERTFMRRLFTELFASLPRAAKVIDWGAGEGSLTRDLVERFDTVYAVEPHTGMRQSLIRNVPAAKVIPGTIMDAQVGVKADVGVISHVFYHIPDHHWGANTIRAASHLTETGMLIVVLKHPDSGCNAMHEAFGAPRFNIYGLADVFRRRTEFTVKFQCTPGEIITQSLEDTLLIARFMMSDRHPGCYSKMPSEKEFIDFVGTTFWDERKGRGGWSCPQVFVVVRPNRHSQRPRGHRSDSRGP